MLKRASDLKGKDSYKDVYIKNDLTRNELAIEQSQHKLCKERNDSLTNIEGRLRYGIQENTGKHHPSIIWTSLGGSSSSNRFRCANEFLDTITSNFITQNQIEPTLNNNILDL